MRALFFPWSAGGGAGYTGRSLAVATALRASNVTSAFGPEALRPLVEAARFELVGSWDAGPPKVVPDYLPFANVERVYAVAARYYRRTTVESALDRDLAAIDAFRPDVVVIDMQPTAAVAARIRGLPLVSLADTDFLCSDANAWMPWVDVEPELLLPYPSCLPVFNELLEARGLAPVTSLTELLWGDVTIVPSAAEVEPAPAPPAGRAEPVYVGPIWWDPPGAAAALPDSCGRTCVYVTIGSGGMVSAAALTDMLTSLARNDLAVFVSGGTKHAKLTVPPSTRIGGFTGLTRPLAWADVVVNHGGYSTVLAALAAGRPQVVVPFMSEQEANGRNFVERLGAGVLARKTRIEGASRRLTFTNRCGDERPDARLHADDVAHAVCEVVGDPAFAARADDAGAALRRAQELRDLPRLFAGVAA